MEIVIIGAGQFGSALAKHFLKTNHQVNLLSESTPWPAGLSKRHGVVLSVPTQKLPLLLAQRASDLKNASFIISTAKGLLRESSLSPLEFIAKKLKTRGKSPGLAVLSGPSFASEILAGLPTALVMSSRSHALSTKLCEELGSSQLRLYINTDPLGVELSGAFKNVYAILAGMSEGLKLGESARTSLNTRALSEMARIVKALGGKQLTVFGLAGAGDLFLTCSSDKSRNFRFGKTWASAGGNPEDVLQTIGTVEGFWTAEVAYKLCRKKKIRAPLIEIVYLLLNRKITPEKAFEKLMHRETRGEFG